jgi:hypothetical protein
VFGVIESTINLLDRDRLPTQQVLGSTNSTALR